MNHFLNRLASSLLKTCLAGAVFLGILSLPLPSVKAQNPDFTLNEDMLLFFIAQDALSTQMVMATLPSMSTIRNLGFAAAGGYTQLISGVAASALASQLSTSYGSGWASNTTQIFAGAAGTRTNTAGTGLHAASTDPRRTIYATVVRTNNLNPGTAQSSPVSFSTSNLNTANNGVMTVQNQFKTLFTGPIAVADKTNLLYLLDDNVPIDGNNSFDWYDPPVVSKFSNAFSFGAAGSNVIVAWDLYRIKPFNFTNEFNDGGAPPLTHIFLGNLVLKDTGEVGFLAIPEPTTIGLITLGALATLVIARRRTPSEKS